MLPVLCRCCGSVMERSALENPNICATCAAIDWAADVLPLRPSSETSPATSPGELEQFLELDGPTMMECVDAAEQARRAIAETAAAERAEVPSSSTTVSAPSTS